MKYRLVFKKDAFKEWKALDESTREQFRNKLKERLQKPRIKSSKLSGMKNCYKIKLRSSGFRLVYEVRDSELIVSVVAVGKRERNRVYKTAVKRL
jgi:mRNA interferase RelE/StbE